MREDNRYHVNNRVYLEEVLLLVYILQRIRLPWHKRRFLSLVNVHRHTRLDKKKEMIEKKHYLIITI